MTESTLPRLCSGDLEGRWSLARLASVAGSVLAIAVLAGWWLDDPGLQSGVVGFVAMNPVTAIAFLLCSAALWVQLPTSRPRRARILSRCCAATVVLIAVLCLARSLGVWDTGPDLMLFREKLERVGHGLPNRMAPDTALNFLLLGVALLSLDYRTGRRWRPAEAVALVAGVIGLVALAGYVYGTRVFYGVGTFIPMAVNTALGFVVLSVGVLTARPAEGLAALFRGRGPGALLARRLLPAVLGVPLVLGWLRLQGESLGLYDPRGGVSFTVTAITLILAILIWRCAIELERSDHARSRAEQGLRELNEQLEKRVTERTGFLRQVIDANPQLIFVQDREGRFTLANEALARTYGTTVAAVVGRTGAALGAGAGEVHSMTAADLEVMATGRARVIEEDAVTLPTGDVRWFQTVKAPLFQPDGSCHHVLGVAAEITSRRRAEWELRKATHELRALFEASPLAICSVTSDGEVRSWNRAAEDLFGWTAEEVIGHQLPNVPPRLAAEYQGFREQVLAGNPFTNVETRRHRRDGREIDVSISTAPLRDAAGTIYGAVAVYLDIGGRKALEAQLRQAQKMEAVGLLAGGVAHDFNNMLTVIRASAEFLLADLGPADPLRGEAIEIRDATDRAGSLTRQLLAFSRRQVLQPRVLNLNDVVADLEPMVRRLVEENITVVTRPAGGLDRVRADRGQLDQVILNLVVNARDAMPQGGTLLIETANVVLDEAYPRSHLAAQSGPHVVLTVTDTGCGMDAVTQARIFEPFFTTKGVGYGTGLGLATVYGIVQQSGGHIWVYSEVGRGTSFKIYLPRYTGPEQDEAPVAGPPPREERGEDATILVVEDDAAVRSSVRRLLERHGYRVLDAAGGEQALATVAQATPPIDLVISDMVMPGLSGLELCQRLHGLRPSLPVLFMSGYSEEAITRLGSGTSLGPIVEKPFTMQGLLQKVAAALHTEATSD